MSKRVLIVCQHFWPESFRINDIADFFVESGASVDVLCGLPNYPKGEFTKGYGYFGKRHEIHNTIRIDRVLEIKRGNNSSLRIFLNYISYPFFSLFHIPKLLFRHYDHIFIYQLSPVMMALPGILVGKIKHIPTTMYVLDLWPENLYSVLAIKNPLFRRIAETVSHWHYKHVDKLVVLSEKMKTRLMEVTGITPENIIVLPQACEKIYEQKMHDSALASRFSKGFNIVYTGNISPAQSFETVIAAAIQLRDSGITDMNWIIVGDGMSRKWLEKEVAVAGLEKSFYFEGQKPIDDIPKYTDIADVLIGCLVKSDLLEATIPAKVMSYLAAGKPMVLAMDGEVRDLVNNSIKCGYVGPAGDSTLFAEHINKIYGLSKKERQWMGEKAREYHFKHFERNINLSKLYDFIFNANTL